MAELITLARPYAKAAFEQALAANTLTAWAEALATAAVVASEPRVAQLIAAPGTTSARKAETLIGLCGEILPEAVRNFLRVLAENKRLALLPQVHGACEHDRRQDPHRWGGDSHGRSGDRRLGARPPCEAIRSNEFLTGIKGKPRCSN